MTIAETTKKLIADQTTNSSKSFDSLTPLEKLAREDLEAQIDVMPFYILHHSNVKIYYLKIVSDA